MPYFDDNYQWICIIYISLELLIKKDLRIKKLKKTILE